MSQGAIDEELLKPYRMVIHRDRPAQPELVGEVGTCRSSASNMRVGGVHSDRLQRLGGSFDFWRG